jgi:hypothetical protein
MSYALPNTRVLYSHTYMIFGLCSLHASCNSNADFSQPTLSSTLSMVHLL